jgi:Uma2 family endonuclease
MATTARASRDKLWTEEEFLALPETTRKVELLDGEIVSEPSADYGHSRRSVGLIRVLETWALPRRPRYDVIAAPLDIRFGDRRILQPDVAVFVEPLPRPVRTPITTVPDLCIEIASRRRLYDRVTKRQAYAQAGVREYWVVLARLGFVERFTGDGLSRREELRDRLVTPLLPGFELDVAELLKEP